MNRKDVSLPLLMLLSYVCLVGAVLFLVTAGCRLFQQATLQRSAAELYTPRGDLAGTVEALGGQAEPGAQSVRLSYDREMHLTGEGAFLVLELRELPVGDDGLRQCQLTVEQDRRELYTLTVKTFVPEGG